MLFYKTDQKDNFPLRLQSEKDATTCCHGILPFSSSASHRLSFCSVSITTTARRGLLKLQTSSASRGRHQAKQNFSIFKTTAYISAAFMKVSYMDRVLQVGLFDGCRLQAYNDDGGNLIATRRKSQAQSYLYTNNTRTVKLLERDAEKQQF